MRIFFNDYSLLSSTEGVNDSFIPFIFFVDMISDSFLRICIP